MKIENEGSGAMGVTQPKTKIELLSPKELTKLHIINGDDGINITGPRKFEIDFNKVKTLEDVVSILKAFNLTFNWFSNFCPETQEEIFNKGLLKEIK